MKIILPVLALLSFTVSACTIEQQGTELQSEFRPPLTYAAWKTEHYKTQSGQPACVVTSGSLSVESYRMKDGALSVSVKGERKLTPGMNFSVNVNGNHYRTSQEYFSASESVALAQDLSAGGKAYLEWSEPHGHHHSMLRTSTIVKLEKFKQQFEQCQKSLLSQSSPKKRK